MLSYPYANFYEMIEQNARDIPNKVVLFDEESKITHQVFKDKVDTVANFLHFIGIKKGDKVALLVQNSHEFIVALLAATKLGAIAIPINTFLKSHEIAYILNDSTARVLFCSTKFEKEASKLFEKTKLEKIIWEGERQHHDEHNLCLKEILKNKNTTPLESNIKIDDSAVIIYTSGTTGNPKGAMLSFKNIFSNLLSASKLMNITKKDRFIVYLPMFHSFTLTATIFLPLYFQSSIVIIRKLMPFSNIIKQTLLKRVTVFTGIPDVYSALSKAKLPWYFKIFHAVRFFISGASALPKDTIDRFKANISRGELLEGYGLSECSPAVAINPPKRQKVLSVGPALPDVQVKIVDSEMVELASGEIGEIIVKGDNVMQGYFNREEATKETIINGWLKTGDLGYLDKQNYLFIVDRTKDLIISKGINIYPREIEEVIMLNENIKAVAVIGKADSKSGEVPIAYIELEEDVAFDISKLKQNLKKELANYKIPKEFYIIEELPKNATGKVLKRELKNKLQ